MTPRRLRAVAGEGLEANDWKEEHVNDNSPATMNADEVAELLGVDRKTVYDAAGRGELPCRRLGRRLIFGRDAIMAWLNKGAA